MRRRTDQSILDWIGNRASDLKKQLGPEDQRRMDQYLTNVREIERRIQQIENRASSGEQGNIPEAPSGVPESFAEHVELMFDLQVLAFAADTTRVFSFKMGRDASARVFPESGAAKKASRIFTRSINIMSACCLICSKNWNPQWRAILIYWTRPW
jgi:hypothetical protein